MVQARSYEARWVDTYGICLAFKAGFISLERCRCGLILSSLILLLILDSQALDVGGVKI